MKRLLVAACMWMVLPVLVAGEAQAVEARRPPPRKKVPPRHKVPPKKLNVRSEKEEWALHQERLALLARLKEVNATQRDAELAAVLERVREKEQQRFTLAKELRKRLEQGEGAK